MEEQRGTDAGAGVGSCSSLGLIDTTVWTRRKKRRRKVCGYAIHAVSLRGTKPLAVGAVFDCPQQDSTRIPEKTSTIGC